MAGLWFVLAATISATVIAMAAWSAYYHQSRGEWPDDDEDEGW